ncbi:MAG: PIN domain-containing protein [Myxococcales bacterium]|nr:PIN domain-containing protein [Myxococcales bacterium]
MLGEPGGEWVEARLDHCGMSVINLEEVLGRLSEKGASVDRELEDLARLRLAIFPFTAADALFSAKLRPRLAARGLSLGDRACLLSARRLGVPAVTADGSWTMKPDGSVPKRAKLEGVAVIQLRPRGPTEA